MTVAVILSLLLGSPVVSAAALTLPQIAALAGMVIKNAPAAIKTTEQLIAFTHSPQFRAWVAANSEEVIRLQPGISTER